MIVQYIKAGLPDDSFIISLKLKSSGPKLDIFITVSSVKILKVLDLMMQPPCEDNRADSLTSIPNMGWPLSGMASGRILTQPYHTIHGLKAQSIILSA